MKKLTVILLIACLLLAACAPMSAVLAPVTPGNAVSPADAPDPVAFVTPADAGVVQGVTPSNAERVPVGLDTTQYPELTQAFLDKVLALFFEDEVRYFAYDYEAVENPNLWIDKPLITLEEGGKYESMDAKAYQDGVVYDMFTSHRVGDVGFCLNITGRNLMSAEEADALRPSDGVAWMSLMQGVLSGEDPQTLAEEVEKSIPYIDGVTKAAALLTAMGIEPGEPSEVTPTYRLRGENGEKEYGWLVTFGPYFYESVQIGVTAAGYGQLWWTVEF